MKVLILGAGGAIAQHVIEFLVRNKKIELSLFARNTKSLSKYESSARIIEGDVLNQKQLDEAISGQNIVYANLSGQMDELAQTIVNSMNRKQVKRLIFVTSLGIYNEIPGKFGEWNQRMIGAYLPPYRKAADIIEKSSLDYTVVRPSWLTDNDEINYETTQKGEAFIGTEVARKAVADYIVSLIENSDKDIRASVGVNKPGVYGDKPAFY